MGAIENNSTGAFGSDREFLRRSEELLAAQLDANARTIDRLFAGLMAVQWLAGIAAALWISPYTWIGQVAAIHLHVIAAVVLGGAIAAFPIFLAFAAPGRPRTRHAIAVGQMLTSALLIHLTGGRIETHFHVFGSLAFLAFYRDGRVLVTATIVVAGDHFVRGVYYPQSVFGVLTASPWRWLEHAAWVGFEDIFLAFSCVRGRREAADIARQRARLEATNQLVEQEVRDRTQRLLEESRLRQLGAERLRMVVDTARDAFVGIDSRGRVTDWNPRAESLFGWSRAEILGRDLSETVVPERFREKLRSGLARFVATGEAPELGERVELSALARDGGEIPVEITVSPLRLAPNPEPSGSGSVSVASEEGPLRKTPAEVYEFFAFVRDITERKRIDRLQSEFISTVTHELQTPLTSIRGSLGLIAGGMAGALPSQAGPLVDIALKNSARLVRLIGDLQDIENISSGKMRFDASDLKLMPLLAESIEANRAYAAPLGVRLSLEQSLPGVRVAGDPDRLRQVLTHLLSNAVKVSPRDAVVSIRVTRNEDWVRVEVADRGPGIPEEFRGRIFQRFAQVNATDTQQKSGMGLGLSIAKAIVERLGGRIGFTTEDGAGTTFFFELQAISTGNQPPEAAIEKPSAPPSWWPRILTCDGDRDTAETLRRMLANSGFAVDVAVSAAEARDLLAQFEYDLMTLDLRLPDADGVSFLHELREGDGTQDLPIVLFSARADEGSDAFSADAFMLMDWIGKPADHSRLIASVNRFVRRHAGRRSRILHIEDDPELAGVVSTMLSSQSDIRTVATLAEAERRLREEQFDLILLDQELPDGHGMDLVPRIRSLAGRPIPVVVFSAFELARESAGRVAAELVKSRTSHEELLSLIHLLLGREDGLPAAEPEGRAPAFASAPGEDRSTSPPRDSASS